MHRYLVVEPIVLYPQTFASVLTPTRAQTYVRMPNGNSTQPFTK